MKLQEKYTTSAMMHLLRRRYGLNPHGVKMLLKISTKTFNDYTRGRKKFSAEVGLRLVTTFDELAGRIETEVEGN